MSLADIRAAFQAAVQARALGGDTPVGLGDLLASLGAPGGLAVEGGAVDSDDVSAWLTGTTTYLGTAWALTLTGTPQEGTDRALLVLDLTYAGTPAPWTFGAAFGDALPPSRRPADASGGGGLILGDSVLAPLILEQPAVHATNEPDAPPRLSGTLPLRGGATPGSDLLAPYADFLGDRLYADGTVEFRPAGPPAINLRAPAPGVSLEIARLAVSAVGLILTTEYPDPAPLPEQGAPCSAVLLFADVELPTVPVTVATVSGPLLAGDYVWPLEADFSVPLGLAGGIQALLAITGGDPSDFALPPGITPLDAFGLKEAAFGIVPVGLGGPGLSYVMVDLRSSEPWDPPVPFLTIDEVGTRWAFHFGGDDGPLVTGAVYGTMRFGEKTVSSTGAMAPYARRAARGLPSRAEVSDIVVAVELALPDLAFWAGTEEPFDVAEAFRVFFGDTAVDFPRLVVESMEFLASLTRKELTAGLKIGGQWDISAGAVTLSLTGLELQVEVSQNAIGGALQAWGRIALPDPAAEPVQLLVRAAYPGTGVWEFGAIMRGSLDLPRLVTALLRLPRPAWLDAFAVELADLGVLFSTASGNPFSAHGTLSVRIGQELLGIRVQLTVAVDVERRLPATPEDDALAVALRGTPQVDGDALITGSLSGTFAVNGFGVTAEVSVTGAEPDFTFSIAYRDASLRAVTTRLTDPDRQVLTIRLTGTLGDLLTYLVALVNPNATFRLDPPWDFLGSIDLSGLSLIIDPTQHVVSVSYDLRLDLGFVAIDSVGLRYDNSSGTPAVSITLSARMLGDTTAKPVSWDPVNQAPPQPPGLGERLFSLRYLGLGQHVTPKNLPPLTTSIPRIVDALVASMRPVDPVAGQPPVDPVVLAFDPASGWLLALDAKVMDTVALQLAMHDPDLFGMLVTLSGPQAGSLAGLSVELLYRKVTDGIGVFHARLEIPYSLRQLQFELFSVTLGAIAVDIYTNGNFRVDLGFPAGGDFSDSFAVEAGPYIGRGGLYFGLLSGATSSRVPQITNGTFSPVIELGIGLSFGTGRTYEQGPLRAGLYLTNVLIVEGALAWFHPDDDGRDTELFYWCKGTVGITGRLYGSVDFKVIAVDIDLSITALATVELEAYRAATVSLSVSVRASARIRILFVTISFSFSLTLSASFTLGADSTPPWRVAPGTATRSLSAARRLTSGAVPGRRAIGAGRRAIGAGRRAIGSGRPAIGAVAAPYRLVFDPDARVFPGGRARTAHAMLVPAYTIADVPVDWTGTAQPANPAPGYRLVLTLIVDGAVPVGATTIAEALRPDVSRNALADTPADTSFNTLAEAVLRWSLHALGVDVAADGVVVTAAELSELVEQLALPETAESGLTWANIAGFLTGNVSLVVHGTPAGGPPPDITGVPFPMPPVLGWTATGLPDPDHDGARDFAVHRMVDAGYEAEALAYFADLDPRPASDRPSPEVRLAAAAAAPGESMATFVLRDYVRLLARATAQAAADLLAAYPYQVGPGDSLGSVARGFPTATVTLDAAPGDGVEEAASRLGVSAAELTALNPDLPDSLAPRRAAPLDVTVAVTPAAIALANPEWAVAEGVDYRLGPLPVVIGAGRTLAGLAADHRADLAALLAHLRDAVPLLRAGAALDLAGATARLPGLTVDQVDQAAAALYLRLRYALPRDVPLADWYQQAIVRLNGPLAQPLPGTVLVPDHYQADDTTSVPVPWPTLPGDTLLDVAARAALAQNLVPGSEFEQWLQAVRTANPGGQDGVLLPDGATAVVQPGDTLATLAGRLLLDPAEFDARIAAADVLTPLTTVEIPDVGGITGAHQTLLGLAQAHGLGLADLAGRVAEVPGLLAPDPGRPLIVPDVPAVGLDHLLSALHDGAALTAVSGQVARFMLHGLRLPEPVPDEEGAYHATGPMTGLYELIGQQVTGPVPPPEPPADAPPEPPAVTFTVAKSAPADWLAFADAVVGDGAILPADEAATAVVSLTADDLRTHYPATGLAPEVISPPAALPASRQVGVRHPVTWMTAWHTTADVPLQPAATGPLSLWRLPADLVARAGSDPAAGPYVLEQTVPRSGTHATYTALVSYAWATLVPFAVRRVPGLPGTVEVLGADTADRQLLALLLEHLHAPATGQRAELTLAWRLPPAPGRPDGLTSSPLSPTSTFLARTNLSTVTRSGPATARAGTVRHTAALGDAEGFLTLLWECSVVGGGGYWLHLAGDVPDALFDQDGNAGLSLIVRLSAQDAQDASPPDLHLRPFTNVAVVGDGVDPATVALSVRSDPPEPRSAAGVDPGRIGLTARLARPDDQDTTPQGQLRHLYGLLGYQVLPTAGLRGSGEGRPVPPRPADPADAFGLPVATEDAEAVWEFTRAVDISRFAASRVRWVPGVPPADGDPYAGVTADAPATLAVWFGDVFGNRSGDPCPVSVPVRYTDPVLGVGAWPSTTTRYSVQKAGDGGAVLEVAVDLQAVAHQPGPAGTGASAAAAAADGRERFATAYWQLAQPDVTARLFTSLQQSPGSDPDPLPADVEVLRRYLAGAGTLLGCLAAVGSAVATGAATPDEVCLRYGTGFDALAAANADTPVGRLVGGGSAAVPVTAAFRHGDTVTALCAALPSPPDPVGVLLDEDNTVLPLAPGTELTVPPHEETVPDGSPSAAVLAAALGCSVARLVTANLTRPGLLTPGFVFEVDGLQVAVATEPPASEATLAGVTGVFHDNGVPLAAVEIVALNAGRPGMFRTGASVVVDGYLAVSGDTLAANGAHRTPSDLAPLNTGTPDLFPPGTPVFLTTEPTPLPADETLARFAEAHGTTPGALLRHNGSAPLPPGAAPVVPGRWAWPDAPEELRVPYTVRADDTLAALAERFPGADLVRVNADVPGTVAPGVTVTVGDASVTTTAAASFDEVRALFTPPVSLDALAAALAEDPHVLAPGALLICPPGVVPAASPGETGVTPEAAADAFGVPAAALLAANAGTPDLLLPGRPLRAGTTGADGSDPVEVTAPSDTLTAVVERLHRRGVITDLGTVAEANATAPVLRPGALLLVPPATARLTARLGAAGWAFPGPVFPVTVAVEVSRDPALVDPALAESATRARTTVPASRTADPAQGGARGPAAFAEDLQSAVPPLRLATGQASGTDVWAVVFGTGGIGSVAVSAPLPIRGTVQPRTFALRPLATTLVSLTRVSTPVFDPASGTTPTHEERDYQGADAEVWARSFLSDVEDVLSPAYVRAAHALAPGALDGLVAVKERLAGAVAEGLAPVLDVPGAEDTDARTAAVETLRQELLRSLTRGYDTAAVLQYDTRVTSVWPDASARLTASPVLGAGVDPSGPGSVTLSGGKISLADSGDPGESPGRLSLLLSLPDPAEHAVVDLAPHLRLPEIEFGIAPGVDGYERSDWLTFLSPPADHDPAGISIDLGTPRVPIPLRGYPAMPTLLDHQALVPVSAAGLADALHWQYRCAVRHHPAEQDTIDLTVVFNRTATVALAAADDGLFTALARYSAVSAPLLGLLTGLRDWQPSPDGTPSDEETVLAEALGTLAGLASEVAGAWQTHWSGRYRAGAASRTTAEASPATETHRYALRLTAEAGWYTGLRLTRPAEPGPAEVGWPDLVCVTGDGERIPLRREAAGGTDPDTADGVAARTYAIPARKVPASGPITLELTFPRVHIARYQNASASVRVTRNAGLLGEEWPGTAPDFVYRTPETGCPEPVVPYIDISDTVPIAPWPEQPLGALFEALFDGDPAGRPIAVGARYAYTLVPGEPPLTALLPVVQSTLGTYDEAATPTDLTAALDAWRLREQPAEDDGAWAFRITLHSSVDPSLQRPLLQLRHVSSSLAPPP
ncbi:hypothetical protein ACH4ZX_16895 [Streptomyces sp. NPDC020490]|uniref:hypothetical protein n=1 Tax=Streptomyces sp. NPDC020490 TaxID=3365078 RepID=UPI00378837EA